MNDIREAHKHYESYVPSLCSVQGQPLGEGAISV